MRPSLSSVLLLSLFALTGCGSKSEDTDKHATTEDPAAARARREAAEQESLRRQAAYQVAIDGMNQALAKEDFDLAAKKLDEAGKVYQTEEVINGYARLEAAKQKASADRIARALKEKEDAERKVAEDAERAEQLKRLIADGNDLLKRKQYDRAIDAFQAAKKLSPDNPDVLTGLTQAQLARDEIADAAKRKEDEAIRRKNLDLLRQQGRDLLKGKQFDQAVDALEQALKLQPDDADLQDMLRRAQKGRAVLLAESKTKEDAEKRVTRYQKLIADGQAAITGGQFDDAVRLLMEAKNLFPEKNTDALLKQARAAQKKKADQDAALALKKGPDDGRRMGDLKLALDQARAALASKDLPRAAKALQMARNLDPLNGDLQRLQDDLRRAEAGTVTVETDKKRRAEYAELLMKAQAAWKAGKLEDAITLAGQAGGLVPDGKESAALLRDLQRAQAAAAADEKRSIADKIAAAEKVLIPTKGKTIDKTAEEKRLQAERLAAEQAAVKREAEEKRIADEKRLLAEKIAAAGKVEPKFGGEKTPPIKTTEKTLTPKPVVTQPYPQDTYLAEQKRLAEQRALDEKRAAEEKRALAERLAAAKDTGEKKRLEAQQRAAEEKRIAERAAEDKRLEQLRLAAEKAATADKLAGEKLALAEKLAEAERIAAEQKRLADAAKRAEADRLATEKQAEAERRAQAERRALEEKRAAEERRALEEKRLLADKMAAEQERIAAEKRAAAEKRLAAEKLAAEQKRLDDEKRAAAAERERLEKLAADMKLAEAERLKLEAERRARDEAKKKEAETQAEVQRLLKEAEKAMSDQEFDTAKRHFEAVLRLQPGNAFAQRGVERAVEAGKKTKK